MESFSNNIIKYRWLVILMALLLTGIAGMGAQKLTFRSDYKTFFDADNKQLNDFNDMQTIYSKSDNVAFIVAPTDGEIFNAKNLTAIWELTDAAWQITYSSRVDSITNYQYSWAEGDDIIVEDLVLDPEELNEALIARAKRVSLSEPQLTKRLISDAAHVAIVNVTLRMPFVDRTKEAPEVALAAREVRDRFAQKYPDIKFMLSGMVMMNNSFPEAALNDTTTLMPLMLLVVILTVAGLLRSVSGTLSTVVVIATSIITAIGLWGWLGGYMTGPSSSAPTVILTLAVADCVHILSTFYYDMRHGMSKHNALVNSLRVNMQPIFLTSLTTAIGFLTMNFSESPPFTHLGNIVAIGVTLAFIFSVTIFPALLAILPVRIKPVSEKHKVDFMDRLAGFVITNRKWLLPVTTIIILSITAFVPKNELNDNFVEYFDTRVPFRQATDFMQENMSGLTTIELSFDSGEPNGVNSPKFLATVANFSEWLRAQPQTDHVNTITDTIMRLNRNMHGDDPTWYKLPEDQDLAAQYLFFYELSLPQGLDVNNQLNIDKSSTRVVTTFKNITSNELLQLEQRINAKFAEYDSGYTLTLGSPMLMFSHIGTVNIRGMLKGSLIALLLISVLLGIALRSFKFGLVSLLPNLFPIGIAFGLWGIFVGQVGLGLSVVSGVTLGIIVDDTVHFLSKYVRARREKKMSSEDAIRYSFASVGRALWITTMVLVAGFSVMATSSFKINAEMGFLTAVTILIALAVDFFFLPPLLILLAKRSDVSAADTSSTTQSEV